MKDTAGHTARDTDIIYTGILPSQTLKESREEKT